MASPGRPRALFFIHTSLAREFIHLLGQGGKGVLARGRERLNQICFSTRSVYLLQFAPPWTGRKKYARLSLPFFSFFFAPRKEVAPTKFSAESFSAPLVFLENNDLPFDSSRYTLSNYREMKIFKASKFDDLISKIKTDVYRYTSGKRASSYEEVK